MDLKLVVHDRVLVAELTGRLTLREAVRVCMLACDGATERSRSAILLDASAVSGELTLFERYELGRTMAEYHMVRGGHHRVALLGSPPSVTGFAALVASNRGVVAERFSDRQKAMEWLKSTAPGLSRARGNSES
jgi:hypothetical protein